VVVYCEDPGQTKRIKVMEQLDEQERKSLYNIIDGLFAKKKLKDTLSSALAQQNKEARQSPGLLFTEPL
jgi:hypothetical protein